ncbi:mediator of RNA polymerase II transcription subunit 20 [Entomortierella parvispora]|uniref:Mediator of RNA polymerase II transcription subunit 20 n=1 Tax=Entomortierella parvispora TaxID=205924 RepID=A0A9P3HLQ8_9FUNG|nr:mediator of RNA polymerase II transcription subunit 20 [Entomortierella parvispora]
MGATCLVHWKDANGQQSLTLLTDRLHKQFHGTPIGRWTINWKVFRDISPVSKSGTGKMMHVVHVQGGATTKGLPAGALSANSTAAAAAAANISGSGMGGLGGGNIGAGAGGALGGGPGAGPGSAGGVVGGVSGQQAAGQGVGVSGAAGQGGVGGGVAGGVGGAGNPGAATGPGGAGKTGLGIMPSVAGGPGAAGSGGPGSAGAGAGGAGAGQVDAYNTTAWCLIDDGAVGVPSSALPSSATSSVANTPMSSGPTGGLDSTPKRKAVLVEVEKDIEALIAKLKNLWVHRQHAQVDGYVFDLGDFIVRVGNIMVGSTSYKGMLIEVEYLPQTSSATASNAILEEFVRLISPPGVNLYSPNMLEYPYDQVGLDPGSWSMLHSGFQYMTLFRRQHIL